MTDVATIEREAVRGDAQAQVQLAFLKLIGSGVTRSIPEAVALAEAASVQGSSNAMMLLAALAARGVGRRKSLDDAYSYIKRAAAFGHAHANAQLAILGRDTLDRTAWNKPIKLNQLAAAPRVASIEGFIPRPVCEWLIKGATGKLQPCTVFDPTGRGAHDPARTNTAAAFHLIEGDLIQQLVCRRMAIATGLPLDNQERMNILHYEPGQEYKLHFDFIRPGEVEEQGYTAEIAEMGQRAVTVLVYLNDEYEGGETVFPRLDLKFKGKAGDALVFWNISESGALECDSLHAGSPVVSGEKWLLSQWIREKAHPLI